MLWDGLEHSELFNICEQNVLISQHLNVFHLLDKADLAMIRSSMVDNTN